MCEWPIFAHASYSRTTTEGFSDTTSAVNYNLLTLKWYFHKTWNKGQENAQNILFFVEKCFFFSIMIKQIVDELQK